MRVPRLSFVLLISLLSIASALGAPRPAVQADLPCPAGQCSVYLPVAVYDIRLALISPANGEQITTLAPSFSWQTAIPGIYRIQVSPDLAFSPFVSLAYSTTVTIKTPVPDQISTRPSSNLKAGTTLYWRVGISTAAGYQFTEPRSFTTPANDAAPLPGTVFFLQPKNNARVSGVSIKLIWSSIPGAQIYRVRMFDSNDNTYSPGSKEVPGTQNTLTLTNVPAGTYHWKVKALNAFGWGEYPAADNYFTVR